VTELTTREALNRLIENDARNIRDSKLYEFSRERRCVVVADCAARLFQARYLDSDEGANNEMRLTEANLKEAVRMAGLSLDEPRISPT
jgi:hypothetical protein